VTKQRTFKVEGNPDALIDKLTIRQKRFAEEYMVDFNATEACQRAGYNTKYPNRMGHQLLETKGVMALINKLSKERASKSVIKPDYVIKKVVRTIEQAETENNHSAVLKGCELLARHLGMFIERTELSGPEGGPIQYERVKEAADAFTRSISSLIEREGTGDVPIIVEPRNKG
jgi:phage terminase small subunit